ncbi:MAG: hypothetical protein LBQ06_01205 [Frankiaceae bacterium]|nr:hypothetical protein [Frankiaceae bacterium]
MTDGRPSGTRRKDADNDDSVNLVYGGAALAVYMASVVLANVLTARLGLVAVGFGLVATAGTYAIGGAYGTRDLVQWWLGRWYVFAAMAAGAVVSWWLATPRLAVASGATFALAEVLAFAVFVPLRRRGFAAAVAGASAAGVVADTFLFLWLAGFPLTLVVVAGQLLGKAYVTAAIVLVRGAGRAVPRQPSRA